MKHSTSRTGIQAAILQAQPERQAILERRLRLNDQPSMLVEYKINAPLRIGLGSSNLLPAIH